MDFTSPSQRGRQRIALAGLGTTFLLCAAACTFMMSEFSSESLLIGTVTGFQIGYVAVMVGLIATVAFVFLLPTRAGVLFLKVPFAIATGLLLVAMTVGLLFVADTKVTTILVDGCASGYIAVEPSGGAGSYVGVHTGFRVESVQTFSGDDFRPPLCGRRLPRQQTWRCDRCDARRRRARPRFQPASPPQRSVSLTVPMMATVIRE